MHHRHRGPRLVWTLLAAGMASLALAACGGSSGDATALLKQTFSGSHRVDSGNLGLSLTINPSGSSTLRSPITLSFGGPFQSRGAGKVPQSNFNVSISSQGKTGSLGIISTGTNGFVTLRGTNYPLPPATFKRLESSFTQLESSPSGSAGSGGLGKLGIQPLHWLMDPKIVGSEAVAGTDTTHIRAAVNVAALLNDFNTFLQRASSRGVPGASNFPQGISPATRTRIASEVRSPTFDVWTGKSDKTIRKLSIQLNLPVSGQISTLLGGLRSAGIGLTMQYANLNQPQTITAPASVRPFSEFASKVRTFIQGLQSSLGAGGLPGGSSSGGSGTTSTPGTSTPGTSTGSTGSAGSTANYQAYSQCIQAAGNDIAKMQGCAPLLNGGR